MHKTNFNKVSYIVFGLLILIFSLILFRQYKSQPEITENDTNIIQDTKKQMVDSIYLQNKQIENDIKPIINIHKNEVKPQEQSSDEFETIVVNSIKATPCLVFQTQIKQQKDTKSHIKWNKQQQDYFNQVNEECLILLAEFPDMNPQTYLEKLNEIIKNSTSPLAKIFMNNKHSLIGEENLDALSLIAHDYPELITIYSRKFGGLYYADISLNIKRIIQSDDQHYLNTITAFAHNLFACQQGANCSKTSQAMITYCNQEPNFCVDNFIELYNTRLSAGVKADVQLALKYFKKLYRVSSH